MKAKDKIIITQLKALTIIGIYPREQINPQPVFVDIEFRADIKNAAQTDCIDDAIDYHLLSQKTVAFIEQTRFQLLETLIEQTAAFILQEFPIRWLKLTISKPQALLNLAENVQVQIVRIREG